MTKDVNRVSFSLQDEYRDLLKEIAWRNRRSMTEELRVMIDARAQAMNLSPISAIDPKHFGPVPEMAL